MLYSLAISVILVISIGIFFYTNTAIRSNPIQTRKGVHPAGFDKFGIAEIYPTKSGGREWCVNMDDPRSDPFFKNLNNIQFVRQLDGSWQISSSNGQGSAIYNSIPH